MSFTYQYARPALTVDAIVFGLDQDELKVLLIQRAFEPFKGKWAFPGGFVEMDETTEAAVLRELQEETGIKEAVLEQLYTFSVVNRDPRERVVSVAYFGLVKPSAINMAAASDAADVGWFPINDVPALAFDHREILETALGRLRMKIRYEPIGFDLLPKEFVMSDLLKLYCNALGRPVDKRNFIKKINSYGILRPLPRKRKTGAHRPATLYSFDKKKYEQLRKAGIDFEI